MCLVRMCNNFILIMEMNIVYKCSLLLLLLCMVLNCRGCRDEERDALQQIKASINSPEGTAFSGWYEEDCCQWEGVECDPSTTRVKSILFYNQRDPSLLDNWYPNASLFAQFKDLEQLDLPRNRIGGFTSPDELKKLKHLQRLDLSHNSMKNASDFCWGKGKLLSLKYLDLSNNKLKGRIPECLRDALSLTELILSQNNLQGNISSWLSSLTSLNRLDLSENNFSGSFPSFLVHNLTNIEALILSSNQFKGRVSFSIFANLSKLSLLDISYNAYLELETESPTWFPSFNLTMLNIAGCNLGNIPSFLSTQNKLKSLDLSDNNLSGPFPKSFRNISSQLNHLDISNNSFYGPLPEDIGLIFPELFFLDASLNVFSGCIPPSLGKINRLRSLRLSENKLHGAIPYLMTSNMSSLESLILDDNNLRGDALPKNSSLPMLKILDLGRNDFTGYLQDILSQSPALPQLRVLLLRGNRLHGQIPQQLCQMRRLLILDLSENDLSGEIPNCIYFFDSSGKVVDIGGIYILISGLDLSCNRLTGPIPHGITQLKAIQALNVSHNLLTGKVPASLGNLKLLESLDLSHNKLFGELPQELAALSFLEVIDVSFNNLSGAIPQGNQFNTFTNDSYVGNPGLCGPPLERKCGADVKKPSHGFSNMATTHTFPFHCIAFVLVANFILSFP